ncbi:MAG: TonB-dependent receptor [Crocinitomicaceae bacterium]|nr:TonB-dependent receptor [Crocinitomicaceae bacterium]
MLRKNVFLFIALVISSITFGQQATLRGFIYEKATGEVIPFQKVKLTSENNTIYGALTDVNGFFSIPKLNKGTYTISITNFNFNTIDETVAIPAETGIVQVKYELEKQSEVKEIEEVSISAESKRKTNDVSISQLKLDKKALERIPSMGAENDIIGAFSVTPGVVTTGDQGGQMYVRGGTPIQNKILLDGITVYTPFHSIGFFSVFETELVKNVDVYTGGFDAKYGGRISSIMDITYRDGNRKAFGGKVSVSPFLGKLVFEGPLGKRKENGAAGGSFIFSAKHSLIDQTSVKLYPSINNGGGMPFSFDDFYGKATLNANGGSKFSFFGFKNTDRVSYTNLADLSWTQKGGGMNFLLVPSGSAVFIRGHLNASNYSLGFQEQNAPERKSSIGGAELGFDFTFFQKNEGQMDIGVSIGGFSTNYITYNEAARKIQDENFNFEIAGYLNEKIIRGRWVFQPGLRAQTYASLGVVSLEPRLGIKLNAADFLRFKLSGGKYSQNFTSVSSDKDVVNLFNGLLSAPTNIQSTLTKENGDVVDVKNGLQYSWHGILGTEIDLGKFWSVNIEGYYKYFPQLSNINQNKLYDDVSENSDKPDVQKKDFIIETGKSLGVDFLLKYTKERWFIWGVYSLGKSTRWDGNQTYFPVFDRRHNVNLVSTYLFGKKKTLELSVRWNLGSGLPFTPTAGAYQNESFQNGVKTDVTTTNSSSIAMILGTFNSERLPYYHRLDVTVKKNYKFKGNMNLEIIGSVTNAYDRKNIFYVNRVTNEKIYQFPLLPSLGMNFKF